MTKFRTRVIDRTVTYPNVTGVYCSWTNSGPKSCLNGTFGVPFKGGYLRTMNDVPTPDYHSRVKTQDISNPANWLSTTIVSEPGLVQYVRKKTIGGNTYYEDAKWTGHYGGALDNKILDLPAFLSSDAANARAYLLTSVIADASNSDFQGQTFAAEALKTLVMLRSPFKGITSLVRKMERRRSKLVQGGLSIADASASAWLEYRYGWKPLLMDCRELFKGLYNSDRVPGVVLRKKRSYSQSWSGRASGYVNSNSAVRYPSTHELSYSATCRAGVRYKIEDPSFGQFLSTSFGLSLDVVPSTVWELVPFSFIADWFVNVDDWIRSVVPSPHVHILSNYTSLTATTNSKMSWRNELNNTGWDGPVWADIGSNGSITRLTSFGDRAVNVKRSSVPLVVPGVLNLTRSLDAFALSFTQLRGRMRSFKHF